MRRKKWREKKLLKLARFAALINRKCVYLNRNVYISELIILTGRAIIDGRDSARVSVELDTLTWRDTEKISHCISCNLSEREALFLACKHTFRQIQIDWQANLTYNISNDPKLKATTSSSSFEHRFLQCYGNTLFDHIKIEANGSAAEMWITHRNNIIIYQFDYVCVCDSLCVCSATLRAFVWVRGSIIYGDRINYCLPKTDCWHSSMYHVALPLFKTISHKRPKTTIFISFRIIAWTKKNETDWNQYRLLVVSNYGLSLSLRPRRDRDREKKVEAKLKNENVDKNARMKQPSIWKWAILFLLHRVYCLPLLIVRIECVRARVVRASEWMINDFGRIEPHNKNSKYRRGCVFIPAIDFMGNFNRTFEWISQ